MFFIFPVSHEEQTLKRIPYGTISIIIICLLLQIYSSISTNKNIETINLKLEELNNYYQEHPNLDYPDIFNRQITYNEWIKEHPLSTSQTEEQQHFSILIEEYLKARENLIYYKYGYIPNNFNLSIISYQFIHGGWLHLITNMWFLWLVGAVIEDIWGRLFFISFYIFCGCFAAISHNLFHANSSEPLVGASGAIAGTMGAFLIKYYKTRINFFYLLIIFIMPKYGTFSLPASIMLILWFLQQIFFALIDPNGLLGIGFIAHIGGFACGAIIAIILIKSGIEKKYLLSRTEAITTLTQKQEIIDAIEAMKNNNFSDAEKYLLKLINKEPDNIDALLLLLEISKKKLDDGASQNYLAALIESYVKKDECKSAADLYNENIFSFPDLKITLQATLKLANYFKNIGRFQDALDLLYKTYKSNENAFAGIKALMTYADLCLSIEKYEDAKNAYLKILQKEIAPELHDHIKIKLAKLNAHSSFYNRLNKKGS